MKKITLLLMITSCLLFANDTAQCKIITSPATNTNVVAGDAMASSIPNIYYDENKKMQVRTFQDALVLFYEQTEKYIQKKLQRI